MQNYSWIGYLLQGLQLVAALIIGFFSGKKGGRKEIKDQLKPLKEQVNKAAELSQQIGEALGSHIESTKAGRDVTKYEIRDSIIVAGTTGNIEQVFESFRKGKEKENPSPEVHAKISELGQLATGLVQKGAWKAALRAFESLLQLDSRNAYVHAYLGLIYDTMGYPETSIMHSQKALALGGGPFMCHFNLGVAYIHIGQYAKAVYEFDIAKEDMPSEPSADLGKLSLFKGEALEKMLHYVQALEEVESSIGIFKECPSDDKVVGFWLEEAQSRLGPLKEKVKEEKEKPPGGLWHILQKQMEGKK